MNEFTSDVLTEPRIVSRKQNEGVPHGVYLPARCIRLLGVQSTQGEPTLEFLQSRLGLLWRKVALFDVPGLDLGEVEQGNLVEQTPGLFSPMACCRRYHAEVLRVGSNRVQAS